MKKRIQQGFTLIELMIVVAIIGILAAVAIPAYGDYTHRSRVTEGLSLTASAKTAVAEYYATSNAWPVSNGAAGLAAASSITGNSVSSIEIGPAGSIIVNYGAEVSSTANLSLYMKPTVTSGGITWQCGSAVADTVPGSWKPTSCR